MRTLVLLLLPLIFPPWLSGQEVDGTPSGALMFNDAFALPLSKAQVFAAALDAWSFTFGLEPGARVDVQDKQNGTIDGAARVNYRSKDLGAREETLGVIAYRVTIQSDNGQCRLRVAQVHHVGNHGAIGGGIDLGDIMAGPRPAVRIRGISLGLAQKIHTDIRSQATDRINTLMKAFAVRMRNTGQH